MLEVSFSENMPKIHRNPIQTAKEIDRGGFFGKIGDALFGKKKMFGPDGKLIQQNMMNILQEIVND